MNAQQWERAKDVFDAALQLPEAERSSFIVNACHDDPELADEIALLLEADANVGSFLDKPVLAPANDSSGNASSLSSPFHLIPVGEIISGRFEIKRFLGQGGMGQVYEAEDLELRVTVALKTLRPEISSNEYALTRFRKEVQLTRQVTHPNVCRVFDIGKHSPAQTSDPKWLQPFAFLTMELLDGCTLADLLRQKKNLSTAESLPIAEQVAGGLTAAHRLGIVHRDVKPSNILLVSDGFTTRAVVTDFGLARTVTRQQAALLSQSESLTAHGHAVGTLAYMAPEQLTGAETTPATDIYAFGLVLYEMVTGVKPWDMNLPFGGVAQRLTSPPPSPRVRMPDLPQSWEAAIHRCTQVDPAARFQEAQEVIDAINDERTPKERSSRRNTRPAQVHETQVETRPNRKKILATVLFLLICVTLFGAGLRLYQSKMKIPEGSALLLTDVQNETQDPELNAVADVLRTQLSQSGRFDLLDRGRVKETLARVGKPFRQDLDPSLAREVAWRAGSPAVIYGSVTKVGPGFSLDLRVEKLGDTPDTPTMARYKSFAANDKKELLHSIQEGSEWIRETVGETKLVSNRPPEDTTTSSWQALLLFSQAERLKSLEHTEDSIRLLQEAVSVDPKFALAYMRLGDLSNYIGNEKQATDYWHDALSVMQPGSLTQREELRIRGMYASDSGDYKKAREHFQEWEALYPRDYLPSFYLAGTLIAEGEHQQAIDKLNEAEKKNLNAWYVVARRARCYIAMGALDQAKADLRRLQELGQWETVTILESSLAFLNGDYPLALANYDKLAQSPDVSWRSLRYSLKASLLSERGEYQQAIATLKDGLDYDHAASRLSSAADKELSLAYIHYRQSDFASCRKKASAAVQDESGVAHLLAAGTLLSRCGAHDAAEKVLRALPPSSSEPVFQIARARIQGEILLSAGKVDDAIGKFHIAASSEDHDEPKEYLARALTLINKQGADREYRRIIDSPGQIWQEPELQWPGLWADSMQDYLRASPGVVDPQICSAYAHLRPHMDHFSTRCLAQ